MAKAKDILVFNKEKKILICFAMSVPSSEKKRKITLSIIIFSNYMLVKNKTNARRIFL